MDFFTCLLFIFVLTAVIKEPINDVRNLAGIELADQQYENDPDFSQISKETLTEDAAKFPDEIDDFPEQYEELDMTKEHGFLVPTDTLTIEMENKEHFQLDTKDTMEELNQENYDFVTSEQVELNITGTLQTEHNYTVANHTSISQKGNMPLATFVKFTAIMLILVTTALIIASLWIMSNNSFMSHSMKYTITYKMKYRNTKLITFKYEDRITIQEA